MKYLLIILAFAFTSCGYGQYPKSTINPTTGKVESGKPDTTKLYVRKLLHFSMMADTANGKSLEMLEDSVRKYYELLYKPKK